MRAIVLAGGLGTRLRPLTNVLPKPLLPIGESSILELLLGQLRRAGVTHVTLALHYKAALFRRLLGDGAELGLQIDYSVATERLGTAGPLGLIAPATESCIVVNADVLTDIDFGALVAHHRASGEIATVAVVRHQQDIPFGVVHVDGGDRLVGYDEKPSVSLLVSAGIYVVEPEAWPKFRPNTYQDVPDLIRRGLASGHQFNAYLHTGHWLDIGTVQSFERAGELFASAPQSFPPGAGDVTGASNSSYQPIVHRR